MTPTFTRETLSTGSWSETRELAFEGVIESDGDAAWFKFHRDDPDSLSIVEPGFVDRLSEAASCYVGGRYLYSDDVRFRGSLQTVGGRPVIDRISEGLVIREGEGEYSF